LICRNSASISSTFRSIPSSRATIAALSSRTVALVLRKSPVRPLKPFVHFEHPFLEKIQRSVW
jgi:hypothetical protein